MVLQNLKQIDTIGFRPVGIVHTELSDDVVKEEPSEAKSIVEIYSEFQEALDGLDGYSHIFVLAYLHKLRHEQIGPLKVKPRRLLRKGFKLEELPTIGVFALDSPTRPNPVGLTLVRLVKKEGRMLTVVGLDYFNGTPVLDVKPYHADYRIESYTIPKWRAELQERAGHI